MSEIQFCPSCLTHPCQCRTTAAPTTGETGLVSRIGKIVGRTNELEARLSEVEAALLRICRGKT